MTYRVNRIDVLDGTSNTTTFNVTDKMYKDISVSKKYEFKTKDEINISEFKEIKEFNQ